MKAGGFEILGAARQLSKVQVVLTNSSKRKQRSENGSALKVRENYRRGILL